MLFYFFFRNLRNIVISLDSWSTVQCSLFRKSFNFWRYLHCMAQCCLNSVKSNMKGFEMLPMVRAGFMRSIIEIGKMMGLEHAEVPWLLCVEGTHTCWGSIPGPPFPVGEFKYGFRPAQSSRKHLHSFPSHKKREQLKGALLTNRKIHSSDH